MDDGRRQLLPREVADVIAKVRRLHVHGAEPRCSLRHDKN